MKKLAALLLALTLLCGAALADEVEPGLLRTAVLYDISTMDVALTTDDYMIPMNVFDRLYETRPVGGASEIVNSLAADCAISKDGLSYTFTLREGVVFSNGSPLTASDVQYSFERLLKLAKQNTEIAEEILGGDKVLNGEADSLEGFQVIDDTHFTITLSAPDAGFLAKLSSPAMSIVDAETMASVQKFGEEPADTIGSGPYIVTEWVPNDHYTLVYNEKYWGETPSVKKLIVRVIPDATTQDLMFRGGELDMIDLQSLDSSIVASVYKTLMADRIVTTPKVGLTYLIMNENNEYLKDVRVRKAISMALDIDQIILGIYMGDAVRECGVIPTGVWAHNDALEPIAYDPAAAKALLKEAGYSDGEVHFELALDSTASGSTKLVYEVISQQLEAVGIKATVQSHEHSAWLALRSSGEMDSFVARWTMDYNDPANIMYTFFGSVENSVGRSLNYADTDTIARVAAVRAIVDDAEREAEYQALENKLIQEDMAWVPMFAELHLYAIGDRVSSFTPQWAGFSDFYAIDVVLK